MEGFLIAPPRFYIAHFKSGLLMEPFKNGSAIVTSQKTFFGAI